MADPEIHARIAGAPYRVTPEQAEAVPGAGGSFIGQQEAQQGSQALSDLSYVDQNWGAAGKAAMGGLSGLTLGLGPGALVGMGLADSGHMQAAQASPWYTAGDIGGMALPALLSGGESLAGRTALGRALSATPAGLMTGVGNLAEHYAGSLLGDSAGLLGRLGAAPIKMAARGATEGALLNLGHAIGDSYIQNKPLAAEAMLASGVDGALMGGLLGGGLGTVGALGSLAVDAAGSFGKAVAGRTGGGIGTVAKHMGAEGELVADNAVNKARMSDYANIMKAGGSDVGESTTSQLKAAKTVLGLDQQVINETVDNLQKNAPHLAPDFQRLNGRLQSDMVAPRISGPNADKAANFIESFWSGFTHEEPSARPVWNRDNGFQSYAQWQESGQGDGLKGTAKRAAYDAYSQDHDLAYDGYKKNFKQNLVQDMSWKDLVDARNTLAAQLERVASNPLVADTNTLRKELLNGLDSEIRKAMEGAEGIPGLEGSASRWSAATERTQLAKQLEENLGKKHADSLLSSGPSVTARDVGVFAGMTAIGHPVSGLAWLSSKGIGRKLTNRLEPWMAKLAYDQSVGTKAVSAEMSVKSNVKNSISKFFYAGAKNAAKLPYKAAQVVNAEKQDSKPAPKEQHDRAAYEEMANRTESLLSAQHQDRVRRYAEQLYNQGYEELAQAVMATNQRAVQYLTWNTPKGGRQGAKSMNSLRAMPVSKVPTLEEHKFMRTVKGVTSPLSLLEDMHNGNVSRDSIQAAAFVTPEIWGPAGLVAQEAAQQIMAMKESGGAMPMDKIMSLGIALNAPIDRVLERDFINPIQVGLNAPAADGSAPPPQPNSAAQSGGSIPMTQGMQNNGFMTPLQGLQV